MEHMHAALAFFLVTLTTNTAQAQESYLFEVDQPGVQPYVELLDDTPVQLMDAEGWHPISNVGMDPFWLFGSTQAAGPAGYIHIGSDGRMRLGDDYTYAEVDMAFAEMDTIHGSSRIGYTYGDGVFAVQYKHMVLRNGINGNYMNVQLRFHMATGVVEFRYGPRSESNGSGFVGNRGPRIGLYHATADGSTCLQRLWLTGTPDGPQVDYATNCEFPGLTGLPPEGTVYRFIPLFTIPEGIEENAATPFRMQNTVVNDELNVTVHDPAGALLRIMDANGRTVRELRAVGGPNSIMLEDLAPGMYSLMNISGGTLHIRRFVKG